MNEASVFADSIPISTPTGIQLCPSLILSSPSAIPQAVKHIYSQLAANANELDEGVADILLTLISHGNSLSQGYRDSLASSLSSLVAECSAWLLTSGLLDDPFSNVVLDVLGKAVPKMRDGTELLHLSVGSIPEEDEIRIDASFNTLFVLSRSQVETAQTSARFRAHFAARLAKPPPALLIGMPGENSSFAAPAILLSPYAPSNERSPLAICLFAGASTSALLELVELVEAGIPALIFEDSCELCSTLHSAWLLTHSAHFSPSSFSTWLESALESLFSDDESILRDAHSLVNRLLAVSSSDRQCIDFVSRKDLNALPSRLLSLCASCTSDAVVEARILISASKLNCPDLLSSLTPDLNDNQLVEVLLAECTSRDSRVDFLSALLDQPLSVPLSSSLLIKMLSSVDKHFFLTVVLPLLGYSSPPTVITEDFVMVLDEFLFDIVGLHGLFPPLSDSNPLCLTSLSIWALLLHRTALVRVLVAYSSNALPLSMVLAKIARYLAKEAEDWFFYADSLNALATQLSRFSLSVLSSIHEHSSTESYRALCHPLHSFGGCTLTQLAYQTSSRLLISHECCQRWVHRLLHGRLQLRPRLKILPRWTRLLLSATFVFPIPHLVGLRPPSLLYRNGAYKSPTVSLLQDIRQPRRSRALSTYSMISNRSDLLSAHLSTSGHLPMPITTMPGPMTGVSTPQSAIVPMYIDDVDSAPLAGPNHTSFKHRVIYTPSPTIPQFYSTPIVKYWMSLFFRLIYLVVFAYSVLLPGCGSPELDTVVWLWTFLWWIETLWVAVSFSKTMPLSSMPWRIFDLSSVAAFLVVIFVMRIFGKEIFNTFGMYPSAYISRVLSAFLLLYQCYATVLLYVPLSSQFGPLMVRVKIMIFRDFTNFLLLVGLIMLSSAVSLYALSYPDRQFNGASARSLFSWTSLSLFTTDLSSLSLSDSCKKSALSRPASYCTMLNSNREELCPAQSWPVFVTLLQYFISLKLVLWPILFAFFAKTAKAVEDEADVIWKYQMYSLVYEFSLRPPLPPPLTPLFFLFVACCRKGMQTAHSLAADHPDVGEKTRSDRGVVYRNPSVPHGKHGSDSLWNEAARKEWRNTRKKKDDPHAEELSVMGEQLRALALRSTLDRRPVRFQRAPYASSSTISRLVLPEDVRTWNTVLPTYSPPFYSKQQPEFPTNLQDHVDSTTQQGVEDLRQAWRAKQAAALLSSWAGSSTDSVQLSSSGLPLNPAGRLGISGRGNHVKFGPNLLATWVIMTEDKILVTAPEAALPSEYRYETSSRDETLGSLLRLIGLQEAEASLLSIRDEGRSGSTGPLHVLTRPYPCEDDTDNAWREEDVWRVKIGKRAVLEDLLGYCWMTIDEARDELPANHGDILSIALTT